MPDDISLGTLPSSVLYLLFCIKIELSRYLLHTAHQTLSRRPITAEERVQSQASPRGICGERNGTGCDFFFSGILLFIPVTIVPKFFHAHSFITDCT